MITYKYKLYTTHRTSLLDKMLREACFVWNHALALQKRYYCIHKKYINCGKMKAHFAKRISRTLLCAQTTQEILERLDISFLRFFKHLAKRPPKFRKAKDFSTIVFKQDGYSLNGNVIRINKIKKCFKFSLCRPYDGKIKNIILKRNNVGEYFVLIILDKQVVPIGKSRNGASVGIDFGLKTYLTLSDGTRFKNPLFMKRSITKLRERHRNFSKCQKGSNNQERKRKELDRIWNDICNKRDDYQWKLAHELCKKYDMIFIEDLNLSDIKLGHKANRKLQDQAHNAFLQKLIHVASKYGVMVHKIDKYYPSSKICTCGYVNKELKLTDRKWVCPHCGAVHDRDLLAANNILRRGIVELESDRKTLESERGPVLTR